MIAWEEEMRDLPEELRGDLDYLRRTLPASDLDATPFSLLLEFAQHARMLRSTTSRCAALSEDVYRDYVLCPRVNDEDLSSHRPLFYGELFPRVQDLTTEEAVLETNRWCHENATYQAQDDRTASPLTVYRNGSGRCGEESAFLVAALRSIGIAARQVYAPRWSHCDDNHAWAEALVDGHWRFLGACEPEPVLDRGWFNTAAARAMLMHSRRFTPDWEGSSTDGELVDRCGAVVHHNQTDRYAPTKAYTFRVTENNIPVPGKLLRLQILNQAEFMDIACLRTDADGTATVALGIGDIWLAVFHNGRVHETLCRGGETAEATLELADSMPDTTDWQPFDFHAPISGPPLPMLSLEDSTRRAEVLTADNAKREERTARFYDPKRAVSFPGEEELLQLARGNFCEINSFLETDANPIRLRLLQVLRPKDLRDSTHSLLEDHLTGATVYENNYPAEIFGTYLLNPRIADELLTHWRASLTNVWVQEGLDTLSPGELWQMLQTRQKIETSVHSGLYWPPVAAWEAGRCDERSLRLLFVALLRAGGRPARLCPEDGEPEYWQDGAFLPVVPRDMGTLQLEKAEDAHFLYGQNWTLSRLVEDGWRTLRLCCQWEGDSLNLRLPVGPYRLLTTVRLPGGDQFALQRRFRLTDGGAVLPLCLREYRVSDLLTQRELPPFAAEYTAGGSFESRALIGSCTLSMWLETGAEPTEHLLNELLEAMETLLHLPVRLYIHLRDSSDLAYPLLARLLRELPEVQTLTGQWAYTLEMLARRLDCDPDRPPLCVLCGPDGKAVYAAGGYNVGLVQLLLQLVRQLPHPPHAKQVGGEAQ